MTERTTKQNRFSLKLTFAGHDEYAGMGHKRINWEELKALHLLGV